MKTTRATLIIPTLVALSLAIGGASSALAATYPPKPGTGLPGVDIPIVKVLPPVVKNTEVDVPKAPESKVVIHLTPAAPNKTDLANLTHSGTQQAVKVTTGLIMGGVPITKDTPKVTVSATNKKNVEIQTVSGVPDSISLTGYKAGELVTITAIQGGKTVVVGTFKASSKGTVVMPPVTLISGSSVKFVLNGSKSGSKNLTVRPVKNTSKTSTETVKIGK